MNKTVSPNFSRDLLEVLDMQMNATLNNNVQNA